MRASRLIPVLALLLLVQCSSYQRIQRRSTVMDFLYPSQSTAPIPDPARAVLQLPLRIGVAFVPPVETASGWRPPSLDTISEKELLEVVRKAFQGKDWVRDIQIIPTTYLNSKGGFENIDQVARMFGTDVVVLTGFDQVQYNDPQLLSIAYLSIVGAYVDSFKEQIVSGQREDVKVITAEGKTMRGGGSLGLIFAAAALAGALMLRQTK